MISTDDMTGLKAVFFDLGGTLIKPSSEPDTRIFEMFTSMLHEDDPRFTIEDFRDMNQRYWQDMQNEYYSLRKELSIEEYNSRFLRKEGFSEKSSVRIGELFPEIVYQYELESTELMPGAMELLGWLKMNNLKMGIITNASHSEARIRGLIRKVGIEDFFDIVIVSSEVGIRKPDAGIFMKALSALGVEPNESLYIGDRYDYDAIGAENTGMRWILLDNQTSLSSVMDVLKKPC